MRDVQLSIDTGTDGITVTMPPAGNRIIVGLGLGLGFPYLIAVTGASIAVPLMAPDELRRNALLGTIAINLLFFIAHILAVAGVWLAFYNLSGTETLEVRPGGIVVRRKALGITVPIKLGRRGIGSVRLLDPSLFPGKVPHPRLEIRAGGMAARFGAGLTADEAVRVRAAVAAVVERDPASGSPALTPS